ncbi:MAG: cell division ATP-binding protein FtsE [Chitinophagales bacterium]
MSLTENVIDIKNGNIYHDEALILNSVNLEVKKGEFVYMIGKTGTGKSSLLKTLYAELPYKSGTGIVAGFDLPNLKESEIPFLRRKLGIVFQNFELLMDRTVDENLQFVLESTGWTDKKKIKNRIDTVLGQVGIQSKHFKMPSTLSGGEQQRVSIARALLNNPSLIIADEPTGSLDPDTSDRIMNLLKKINQDVGTAVFMATHNYHILEKFPARIVRCAEGTIHEEQILSM